ncbi:hypothetical protein A2673_00535 [Candidatus Kaiserbacteria bacterium RIFCSPHIGHO2_01_FULL_50_13]|uniref:Uncharacterized protein n=1 Tax=Candidatus Kaiserbacteria bacterium RIFCSPLOWO2_01_FULL_50_24 TaxID=1798507 RepID=A0A1F6EMQ1_9BACT|nr:MAG: hypothetical protein A2673_00535 [Candidatus Kaiserbacteria bacterium RIFCSPHIGHO2_01_FULL_50_13]OGG74923.1 MAG: hypothetical protein A3A34_03845 [Candidatus Kaiserbacteria bacterium RIFCSPLOWO2_01_FULL_50_24]OGG82247.1 MAG: hypothetical protein A3H74_03570 [Candidatus Kaiserbacteria bacterium RIFCSPLOWO2_02_FULL_51_13]
MQKCKKPHDFYGELGEDPDHKPGDSGEQKKDDARCVSICAAKIFGIGFLILILLVGLASVIYIASQHTF